MIYITGDCHGFYNRFNTESFPEQAEMTRDDYVIVCGDFGIWNDDKSERWWLDWLAEKSFTLLFVDGNHENFDRLYSDEFPIVDFHGGKAHQIRENIYHLMRGYVFDLCGKKIFAFGGARSHDIQDGILDRNDYKTEEEFKRAVRRYVMAGKVFRINHMSWWEQELPTPEEMNHGIETLVANGNKVDFIVTHCCPQDIASCMGYRDSDILTQYFNTIASDTEFSKWFFGHYHDDKAIHGKFILLYDNIVRIL